MSPQVVTEPCGADGRRRAEEHLLQLGKALVPVVLQCLRADALVMTPAVQALTVCTWRTLLKSVSKHVKIKTLDFWFLVVTIFEAHA